MNSLYTVHLESSPEMRSEFPVMYGKDAAAEKKITIQPLRPVTIQLLVMS